MIPSFDTAEILPALSRLNEHARAWGFGKRAIYAYKTFVAAEFATSARPVFVMVRCHHCGGTGTYRDWGGEPRGPCHRCTKGVATLRFVESTIGPYRWHHPAETSGHEVLDAAWGITTRRFLANGDEIATLADGTERPIIYAQAEGWGPNLPGAEKLTPDEACRLLNVVEDWLRDVPQMRPGNRWTLGRARSEITKYQIDLGRSGEGICCECGAGDPEHNCVRIDGWLQYVRPMCTACHGPCDAPRWPREPHPLQLTANVLAWLARPERVASRYEGARNDEW